MTFDVGCFVDLNTLNFFCDTIMEQTMLEDIFILVEKAFRSTNIRMSKKNLCFDVELKYNEIRTL